MARRKTPKPEISDYPVGTFLETEKGFFYVVTPTKRYKFTTKRSLNSWSPQRIAKASEGDASVKKLRVASKMRFRDGSLLYCQADGKMYLICQHKACHIQSPDVLDAIGAVRSDAVWVSLAEINLHEQGEPLV